MNQSILPIATHNYFIKSERMRLFFIFLFFIFAPLSSLAAASSQSADFQEGKKNFLAGNYREADRFLSAAFRNDPANPDINFYLGLVLYELGDYEAALMAFERVLIADPNATRVKLEIARCHFRLGFRELARQYFREVLATKPPEAVWRNIEHYMTAIDEMEKRHLFSGSFSLGLSLDDNVYLSPVSDIVLGGIQLTGATAKPRDDEIFSTTTVINHVYRPNTPAYTWKTAFTNYNAFYETWHDLDVYYYEMKSGPVWKTDRFMWNNHGIIKHIDVEHDRYLDSLGLGSLLTVPLLPRMLITFGGQIEEKDNHSDPYLDATNININFNPVLTIGPNRISAYLFNEIENADDEVNSYDRIGWILSYERLMFLDTTIFAGIGAKTTEYDGENIFFLKKRNDTVQELKVGVSKLLWQSGKKRTNLSGQLSYTYLDSDSNISLYTYRKNLVSLGLTLGFF